MGAGGLIDDVHVAALMAKGKELAEGCQYLRYRILAVSRAASATDALTGGRN